MIVDNLMNHLETKNKIFIINILFFVLLVYLKIDLRKVELLNSNNLITFLTSMIGIFLAIITLLHGLLGGLLPVFKKFNINPDTNLFNTFKELKENTLFIFKILVIIIILSVISKVDIPYIKMPSEINKNIILYDVKFILLLLSLVTIKDTLSAFFKLLDLSLKASKE